MFLKCLYPILDLDISNHNIEKLVETVSMWSTLELFEFQFRAKNIDFITYLDISKKIKNKNAKFQIIANDFIEALDYQNVFSGLHLGQEDLESLQHSQKENLIKRPSHFKVGVSTNTVEHVSWVLEDPIDFDYIAIGPIFSTDSKKDAKANVLYETLCQMIEKISDKREKVIVFIGGIDLSFLDQSNNLKKILLSRFRGSSPLHFALAGISTFQNKPEILKIASQLKDWELTV